MTSLLSRVKLLAGLVVLAVAAAATAQPPPRMPRVGLLTSSVSGFPGADFVPQWLRLLGWVEGENVAFEPMPAAGQDERLPALAAELARKRVDAILATGTPAVRAAKQATTTIPIVMAISGDPVRAGLVASLARPGGNVTGITFLSPELSGKRLQLLKEAVPGLTRVAVLWNPTDADKRVEWDETQAAAPLLGLEIMSLEVRGAADLEPAFAAAARDRAGALVVLSDRLTWSQGGRIASLAARARLPAIYETRWAVQPPNAGLMSYGPSSADMAQRVAHYLDRVLKGTRPAALPVEQPTRFDLVINLQTARALGLTLPQSVLLRADRVFE